MSVNLFGNSSGSSRAVAFSELLGSLVLEWILSRNL